jgi:hypothetical protein
MGRQREIPLVINTSEQDISGSEALINVYPRASTGGKYKFNLINTPGLAYFCELPTFPILGTHENGNRAFAVTPTKFYEIFKNGNYKELGDVDLKGRGIMSDNGIQVVVVDGFKGFYYDTSLDEVIEIDDEGFYPARTVTYQDGYFLFERKDTGQFFISELLSADFDANDFASAEGQPDNLVAVLSDHREVFMFGTRTIEVWYNSGAGDFPFERNQSAFVEKGCAAPYSIAKQNNTVYFIGSDLMVYSMSGYTPIRVSTNIVEKTLKNVDLADAFAYTYQEEGHLFYVLTIPANNITWSFDISTGAWHIMKSYNFGRHQADNSIFFGLKTLVGDFQSGRIFVMSNQYYTDDNEPIVREFVLPTLNNGREFLSIGSLEIDMSTGVGLTSGQGSDPIMLMQFSKDGGKTYSNYKEARIGKIGNYTQRVKWNRLGIARQFIFKIKTSEPIPIDIGGAFVEAR